MGWVGGGTVGGGEAPLRCAGYRAGEANAAGSEGAARAYRRAAVVDDHGGVVERGGTGCAHLVAGRTAKRAVCTGRGFVQERPLWCDSRKKRHVTVHRWTLACAENPEMRRKLRVPMLRRGHPQRASRLHQASVRASDPPGGTRVPRQS